MRILLVGLLLLVASNAWAQSHLQFPRGEFPKTAFENASVSMQDILSGGPPRDGIPPVDSPRFISIDEADSWLEDTQPVVVYSQGDSARAYPVQILMFHEIVNDEVDGVPVAVTFCPLCNASIVFERNVKGRVLDFGTTGRLRNSDLIMYDRQTESWWQQFTGNGIIGEYNKVKLTQLPSQLVAYSTFKQAFKKGEVLSRDTGHRRPYGQNPYRGYDSIDSDPFLFRGDIDPRLPAMERVLSIPDGDHTQLVPLSAVAEMPVINLTIQTQPVVVLAATSANSALDEGSISESRIIPAAAAFVALVDGRSLSFIQSEERVLDEQTGSTWNAFGQAVDGELAGRQLVQVDKGVHFAFAWLAFDPDAQIYKVAR